MQRWNNCLYTGSSISRANLVKSSLYSNYLSIQFILQYNWQYIFNTALPFTFYWISFMFTIYLVSCFTAGLQQCQKVIQAELP